jgi:aspartate/methionine/tyrosine aminotransferase
MLGVGDSMKRVMSSEYMLWAKTQQAARFTLAVSGMPSLPLAALGATIDDLELSRPGAYGYPPLQEALAAKCGVSPDCVVAAEGTSFANHLAMAALIEAGDEVLVEHPVYTLLTDTLGYFGARIRTFPRPAALGFDVDPDVIARAITPETKLICLTNLHNPSSSYIPEETLLRVGELARRVGARVLVDEVYLDAAFELAPVSAMRLGPEFITTNSLTKIYGLSGLRCGWISAEPGLARRMWRLNDLFGVNAAHAGERLSVIALQRLPEIARGVRSLLETNRTLLNDFLASQTEAIECRPLRFGTVCFPRLRHGDCDAFCAMLRERFETSIVPGRYFGISEHFRLGISQDTAQLREGLARLAEALQVHLEGS